MLRFDDVNFLPSVSDSPPASNSSGGGGGRSGRVCSGDQPFANEEHVGERGESLLGFLLRFAGGMLLGDWSVEW